MSKGYRQYNYYYFVSGVSEGYTFSAELPHSKLITCFHDVQILTNLMVERGHIRPLITHYQFLRKELAKKSK